MKTNVFVIKGKIAVLLLCSFIFFGCAGVDGGNGIDPTAAGKGDVISDKFCPVDGYTRELGTFEGLDAEIERRILADAYNLNGLLPDLYDKDVSIECIGHITEYCGTYNEYIVIEIYGLRFTRQKVPPVIIGNYGYIPQSPSFKTVAWNDGLFYTVEELYNQGKLTLNDMRNIASLHHRFVSISHQELYRRNNEIF